MCLIVYYLLDYLISSLCFRCNIWWYITCEGGLFVCVVYMYIHIITCTYVHALAFINVCTYETTALICSTYWDWTYYIGRNTMISCFIVWFIVVYDYMCAYFFGCLLVYLSYIISHMISLNMTCLLFSLLNSVYCSYHYLIHSSFFHYSLS